jgi:hypothetical protein
MLVKISPEYDRFAHLGALPLAGRGADSAEISIAHGEFSSLRRGHGDDAVTTSLEVVLVSQDHGETN